MPIVMYLLFRVLAFSMSKEKMVELSAIDRYIIDRVRELRMKKGYSQEHLSGLIGRSEGYIGNVESPKRGKHYNSKILNELAKALECSPKDFWPEKPL